MRDLAPRSILFVCHGNINRSAYAGAYFRRINPHSVEVTSAGFVGPGRSPPPLAHEVARERGVSMEDHRSRLLEPGLVRSSDLIVVMDARQARALKARFGVPSARIVLLGDFDPLRPERRQVLDPVDRPRDDYERVFDRIERCVSALSRCL